MCTKKMLYGWVHLPHLPVSPALVELRQAVGRIVREKFLVEISYRNRKSPFCHLRLFQWSTHHSWGKKDKKEEKKKAASQSTTGGGGLFFMFRPVPTVMKRPPKKQKKRKNTKGGPISPR